ncbi:hypothetical protein [Corynebacterium caspium]|uniref:hypothetical protein n=1 Tax=Corynebacterium caspium TaxID=234828 RepID=UPI000369F33D|nr:hypothetical protein [Corynebacterium caspium]WKD59905.1 hypothetical protein CCASP_07650 [Corynebacterium caspium DSM 44850]
MATLKITDTLLTVQLEWWEKVAARRSDLTVAIRAITGVHVVDDVFSLADLAVALRQSATRIKGLTSTGTLESGPSAVFAVCHGSGPRPGLVIELAGATVDIIIISTTKGAEYATEIEKFISGLN